MKEIKVFIAVDSESERQQLQKALSTIAGCSLIGAAGSDEANQLVRSHQPDVVILDISMPHREGIGVLRSIRSEVPFAEIIIFTADPSVVLQQVCLEAGADFFLHKTQIQDLIDICSAQAAHI